VPLSWSDWDPASWQDVWIYRRHLDGAAIRGGRAFADFGGVMTSATVYLNGICLGRHDGGYLPWSAELTRDLVPGDNVLAVVVDARWQDVPPDGSPKGPVSVDYLQPGGIYREVRLRVVPGVFLAGVFACPADVLTGDRRVEVEASIDAAVVPGGPVRVTAELLDGTRVLGRAATTVSITVPGVTVAPLAITGIGPVTLWSPDTPRLYTVRTSLTAPGGPGPASTHAREVRTGFREAEFRPGGFYLNGQRLQLLGLNRHQLFPYLGMAAPARLQRRDAEILRRDLNCNMVRCSHYPQSPHFLDACDELGLLVWAEIPGWQYVGGPGFRDIVRRNVADLVIRDRNHPSVIIWGTRLNESANETELYAQTRRIAGELDGSRPASGAMNRHDLQDWAQDVYAYDDYHHTSDGHATLLPPLPGVPYLIAEAVGALSGPPLYRWTDPAPVLAAQGRLHAEVHDLARADDRYAGLLAWCAFDYASLNGGERIWRNLKTPGVADFFRVLKPGAAIYRAQADPAAAGPVIVPMFCWDFGPGSPPDGPGPGAMVATNCERLEFYVAGQHVATGRPDTGRFPRLPWPPVTADLTADGAGRPELRIDGYLGDELAASAQMSADPARDRLELVIEDAWISADGSDMTRLTFRAVDAYGHHRPGIAGDVALQVTGPAVLVGDQRFPFGDCGGVGGAFLRSRPGQAGAVTVAARHATLGQAAAGLTVRPPPAAGRQA
jgi:beta-galactosidase